VTLLVSLAALGASASYPHTDDCHDQCVAFVQHDASAHRFEGDSDAHPQQPLHCLVCHWARSFRPQVGAAFLPAPAVDSRPRLFVTFVSVARAVFAARPSLRSPPHSSLV
jgi:hypothetical protein